MNQTIVKWIYTLIKFLLRLTAIIIVIVWLGIVVKPNVTSETVLNTSIVALFTAWILWYSSSTYTRKIYEAANPSTFIKIRDFIFRSLAILIPLVLIYGNYSIDSAVHGSASIYQAFSSVLFGPEILISILLLYSSTNPLRNLLKKINP